MRIPDSCGIAIAIVCSALVVLAPGLALADPPPPDTTACPPVQCMRIDTVTVTNCGARQAIVWFTTLNWFATTADNGVNEIHITNVRATSGFPPSQGTIVSAVAPPGWTVQSVSADSVVFVTNTSPIPEVDMCNPPGGCAPFSCGNAQGGFGIEIQMLTLTGTPSMRANWKHLSNGVDNGDVMNFGSLRWQWDACGSISEFYSNVNYPVVPVPLLSAVHFQILALLLAAAGGLFVYRRFTGA